MTKMTIPVLNSRSNVLELAVLKERGDLGKRERKKSHSLLKDRWKTAEHHSGGQLLWSEWWVINSMQL